MYPLLQYATNLSNPEAEVLVEEALKCWGVALAGEWGCCGWAIYVGLFEFADLSTAPTTLS
jgi:hypothetical protein